MPSDYEVPEPDLSDASLKCAIVTVKLEDLEAAIQALADGSEDWLDRLREAARRSRVFFADYCIQ
jgi:hypothetical protein